MFYVALHFLHLISEFLELSALSVVGDTRKRVKLSGCSDYTCVLLGETRCYGPVKGLQKLTKNVFHLFGMFSLFVTQQLRLL